MNKSSKDCPFFSNADKDCPFYDVNLSDPSAVLWAKYKKGLWKIPVMLSGIIILLELFIWARISGTFAAILALIFIVSAGVVYWIVKKRNLG